MDKDKEKKLFKTIESLEKEIAYIERLMDRFGNQKVYFAHKGYTDHAIALTKGIHGFMDYCDLLKANVDALRKEMGFKKVPLRVERHLTLVVDKERR